MALIFSNKSYGLRKKFFIEKKFFSVDYGKILELHVAHAWRNVQSE